MRRWSVTELEQRGTILAALLVLIGAAGSLVAAAKGPLWLAVSFAGLGVLAAAAALVLKLVQVGAQETEIRRASWHLPAIRMREARERELLYEIGVDTEAPESLDLLGLGAGEHPPYAPRDSDRELRERLQAAHGQRNVSLTVVSGPSKAGKSRTLFEIAAEVWSDAWLITPRTPAVLAKLAESRPPPELDSASCVVWLDDIESFARREGGLNFDTLRGFRKWKRPVAILGTQGGKGVESAGLYAYRFRELVADLLARDPPIRLEQALGARELQSARERFPDAAVERIAADGLGEFMIAAPRLLDRLRNGNSPEGKAIVSAAIDCRRAGILRPLRADLLEELYGYYLAGPATSERFSRGLEWATEPLYSTVALLQRVAGSLDEYRPHDYLADFVQRRDQSIDAAVWDKIVNEIAQGEEELLQVGLIAHRSRHVESADAAWSRADQMGSAVAADNIGLLREEQGDPAGAEEAYRRAEQRGHSYSAGRLGLLLAEAGDLDSAEAAFQRATESGDPQSHCWLGTFLHVTRGDLDGAEAAYARAEQGGHWHGASQLGLLLQERGDLEGATEAFCRADDGGDASGARRLGLLLEELGDEEAARAAHIRADRRGDGEGAFRHGHLLLMGGDLEGARAAFSRADARGFLRGTTMLGTLLEKQGDLEGAMAAYRRADEGGDVLGTRHVSRLLWREGDLEGAETVCRRAAEDGKSQLALYELGRMQLHTGKVEEAKATFQSLETKDDAQGPIGLAQILEMAGDVEGANKAYVRAERLARLGDNRGEAWSAGLLGDLLLRRRDLDGAEDAYRRAAEAGEIAGMASLGKLLVNERREYAAALVAFEWADARGDENAAQAAGVLLRARGDKAKAIAAFARADTRGSPEGALFLGEMLLDGSPGPEMVERGMAALHRARKRAEAFDNAYVAEQAAVALARAESSGAHTTEA